MQTFMEHLDAYDSSDALEIRFAQQKRLQKQTAIPVEPNRQLFTVSG